MNNNIYVNDDNVIYNYEVIFEEPTLYVDNESRKRSGHMTHAMAEFAPNCFIDFNSKAIQNLHRERNDKFSVLFAKYILQKLLYHILQSKAI